MIRRLLFASLLVGLLMTPSPGAETAKRVLLLGHRRDHPPGTHEYLSGLHVLAKCLQGVPGLEVEVINVDGPWSEGPQKIQEADGIVLYLGEGARWAQADSKRQEAIGQLVARGGALVALHWGIGAKDARYIPVFLPWLGAMHAGPDRKYIVGEAELEVTERAHPILRGIDNFRLKDEFYYRLKLSPSGKVTPLLQARIDGRLETCAWAFERPDGGRSFGFCGMHDHQNWRLVACRRLIAQGVLWSLNLPIPPEGLAVEVTEDDLKIRPDDAAAAPQRQSARPAGTSNLVPIGVAKVDITPQQPVRMYGYASRKTESEGIAGRLKASAMAIGGDEGEGPAVLLCVDCGAVPSTIREEVFRRVRQKTRLKPERFMLCNSHNHSGPNLKWIDSITGAEHQRLAQYAEELTGRLEQVVLAALSSRRPGRLEWTQGSVGFAANRRVLKNGKWAGFGAVPDGAVDHSLPLLRAMDAEGNLRAVVVNYACHNTTLRGNFTQIHGDWAGCAQEYIEADHPGVVALITIGCGADADPCPHGTVERCRQHGRAMADEVKRLLAGPFKPVSPQLSARRVVLEVPYDEPPPVETLKQAAARSRPVQRLLQRLERGEERPTVERYPIATWAFGDDLAMVFLADEVVVDYALRMKREMDGSRLWINAYANDVSYYVVSERLIEEGGYEVNNSLSALVSYGRPASVRPTIEDRIVEQVQQLLPASFVKPAEAEPAR